MAPSTARDRLRVAVTGASGLVGTAVLMALTERGHEVTGLTRSAGRAPDGARVRWASYDPLDVASLSAALAGADAVVHLAGENLFGSRWNAASMARLRSSRVEATRALVDAMRASERRPAVLVGASAVGYYGPVPPESTVDESAPAGGDFLATLCRDWEAEASRAEEIGVRSVRARLGVVLARGGGALPRMTTPFKMFVGGPIGRGRQVVSWIHVDDLAAMVASMVEDPSWRGPVNVTAPAPVSNREFAKALGHALGRPSFVPTPGFALRVMFGKVAGILTTGQRVLPRAAQRLGFTWRFPTLEAALADLLRR